MNDVYGDVPDWRRLVPRERDVVTGRLTGQRDDKRHDDQHDADSDGLSQQGVSTSGRSLATLSSSASVPAVIAVVVAVVAVVGVGGLLGARALGGSGDDAGRTSTGAAGVPTPGAPGAPGAGSTGGPGGATGPAGGASATVAPPAAATAITLEYSGGKLTVDRCTDLSGKGKCTKFPDDYDPLTVRCTADGCTVYYIKEGPLTGPLTMAGRTKAITDGCQQTSWDIRLTPVGEAVTEGIRHPARLVGVAHTSRVPEMFPTVNCLGAEQTYVYDATPS
ncbi:hypothetical protein GCM10022415_10610 [Knoellia locipacati]|uniref:Uncharacterized protein n=1 Tax=Knoellia locipacati TaxID=882824 RepID=A0A512SYJ1_9MICO|nr:hypothetical protein [Knoellia locipacati]GEQ13012.1 hypothetical protein KLO01_10590 [Knoellia locipacati]